MIRMFDRMIIHVHVCIKKKEMRKKRQRRCFPMTVVSSSSPPPTTTMSNETSETTVFPDVQPILTTGEKKKRIFF